MASAHWTLLCISAICLAIAALLFASGYLLGQIRQWKAERWLR